MTKPTHIPDPFEIEHGGRRYRFTFVRWDDLQTGIGWGCLWRYETIA